MRIATIAAPIATAILATVAGALPQAAQAQGIARDIPADIKPVPSGPAVPLAQMQASCDANAVGRTAAARKDEAYAPSPAGAATVAVLVRVPVAAAEMVQLAV